MRVFELGEFGLINLLDDIVGCSSSKTVHSPEKRNNQLLLGIGDDAAAWRTGNSLELATVDTLIEDVHFTLNTITWKELGWKSLAVNISDIAAMGGIPSYALISLGLPGIVDVDDIKSLYQGMKEIADSFNMVIVGGDIVRAPQLIITPTIIGKGSDANILTRSAAEPDDTIAVTGYLGTSAAGLKMLLHKLKFDVETTEFFRNAHVKPQPRIHEGSILAREGVKACIDLSDGLMSDLNRICKSSKVSATVLIDEIPIHKVTVSCFGDNAIEMALTGGEDYELLFTCKPAIIDSLKKLTSTPITVIGTITNQQPYEITLHDKTGNKVELNKGGWDHFPI